MRNLRVLNSAVLGGYAFILMLLAYFFFSHEIRFAPYRDANLADDFILRFSSFWFISFLLTILIYLLNLSLNYLWLPRAERSLAIKAGILILSAGVLGASIVLGLVSLLNTYG